MYKHGPVEIVDRIMAILVYMKYVEVLCKIRNYDSCSRWKINLNCKSMVIWVILQIVLFTNIN